MSKRAKKSRFKNVWVKGYVAVALGFFTVFLLEGLLYYHTNDDFLLRYRTESEHYTPTLRGVNRDLNHYPVVLLNKVSPAFSFFGYYFYLVLLGGIYITYKRNFYGIIPLLWFTTVLLYLQYGSMSLTSYLLIQRIWRFLCVLTIPASLTIAYFLTSIKIPAKKYITTLVVVLLAASSIHYAKDINGFMKDGMLDFRQTAEFLKNQPKKNVYSDFDTIGKLDYLLAYNWSNQLRNIQNVKDASEIRDAYVVVNASRGVVEVKELRDSMPAFFKNPPNNWQIMKVIADSNNGIYGTYNTTLYYAPP